MAEPTEPTATPAEEDTTTAATDAADAAEPEIEMSEVTYSFDQSEIPPSSDDAAIDDGTTNQTTDPRNFPDQAAGPTAAGLMEQYNDLITSKERLDEGFEMRAMLKSMPTKIEEGSEWFFLPKNWLDKWETYCYVDIIDGQVDPEEIGRATRTAPGRISFKHLFEPKANNQMNDISSKTCW